MSYFRDVSMESLYKQKDGITQIINWNVNAWVSFHDPVLPYSDKRKQVTITQIWKSYVFRLDLAYYFHSEFGAEMLILLKDIYVKT